jgi:hypothetical protein
MEEKLTIKTQCGSCRGTGLYRGFAESLGVAVICLRCNGTGCREFEYIPFTGRKERAGVKMVRQSKGTTILACGPAGPEMSYDEFKAVNPIS